MALLLPCAVLPAPAGDYEFLRPALLPTGGMLIYSNNPETVTELPDGGVLYESGGPRSGGAPARPRGRFRVFYHHLNATGVPFRLVVVVTNPNPYPVDLFRLRAAGAAGPFWVGVTALMDFLAQTPTAVHLSAVAPAGRAVVVEHDVAPGAVVSGLAEFAALAPAAHLGAPVSVSVLNVTGEVPPVVLVPTLPLQPLNPPYAEPTINTSGPVRATARASSRLGLVAVPGLAWSAATPVLQVAARIRAFRRNIQPDGLPLAGEYELATDFVDGGLPVFINGNYGIDYTFTVIAPEWPVTGLELQVGSPNAWCTGGTNIVVNLDGESGACHTAGPETVWPYARRFPGAPPWLQLRTSVPGGSCAPARHFLLAGRKQHS